MEPFRTLTSLAAPLDRTNVDTDQIIPKQFLKRIERTGYGDFLFFDWRRTASGDPDPAFVLNDPRYKGAQILIAGKNFGCGSSREHAAWALSDYGFRVRHRAHLCRHLLLERRQERHRAGPPQRRAGRAASQERARRFPTINSPSRLKTRPSPTRSGFKATFEVDPFRKFCLLEGLDDIGLTLRHEAALDAFEAKHDEATG